MAQLVTVEHVECGSGQGLGLGQIPVVGHDAGGLQVFQDVLESGLGKGRVQRNVELARLQRTKNRGDDRGVVLHQQRHRLLSRSALGQNRLDQAIGGAIQLAIGQRVRARLDGELVRVLTDDLLEALWNRLLGLPFLELREPAAWMGAPGARKAVRWHRCYATSPRRWP